MNISTDLDLSEIEVVVRQVRAETSEIRSFIFEAAPGEVLPPFEAGAHIEVQPLPGIYRQYSLVNAPYERDRYVIGVKREQNGRGGSSAMHAQLREGARIRIGRPRNNFTLTRSGGRSLLLAGGIGVTPLLSMAQQLARDEAEFELHYFARSNQELAFRELITDAPWSDRVCYHFGLVPPILDDVLADLLRERAEGDHVYLCGPGPFMDLACAQATAAGWPQGAVVLERFSNAPPRLVPGEDEFVIRLASSGLELTVPSDKTIIEVLRANGIEIKTSCEQGVCGTCVTGVLEGEVEHNDLYLTDDEHESGKLMTLCVSRARSKYLVLDL